jgi:hypothetical protein
MLCSSHRYYGYDGQQVNVEELVRQHFARTSEGGWHGIHSEGGIWATLFGLCFWDVIFSGAQNRAHFRVLCTNYCCTDLPGHQLT